MYCKQGGAREWISEEYVLKKKWMISITETINDGDSS